MADLTLNTAFKSGTLAAIDSATGLIVGSGITFDANDVGRYVMFTSGNAETYYRRITAVDTASNNASVNAPWGTSPFRGLTSLRHDPDGTSPNNVDQATGRFTEPSPAVNDTFVLSYDFAEVAIANSNGRGVDAFITDSNDVDTVRLIQPRVAADRILLEGRNRADDQVAIINARNLSYEFLLNGTAETFLVLGRSTAIFGDVEFGDTSNADLVGYPTNSCHLIDRSTSFNAGGRAGIWGQVHFYGGSYRCTGTTFWRMYQGDATTIGANDAAQSFILHDVDIQGNFGIRLSGFKSIVYRGSGRGSVIDNPTSTSASNTITGNNIFYFNPLRPGLVSDISIQGAQQALYHFPQFAGSTTVPAISIQDIDGPDGVRIIRGNHDSSGTPRTLTLQDWSLDELERESSKPQTELYHVDGASAAHQLEIFKNLRVVVSDQTGANLSEPLNWGYVDGRTTGSQTIESSASITDGIFERNLQAWTFDVTNTVENFQDEDAISFLPYAFVFKARGRSLVEIPAENLRGPIGTRAISLAALPDVNITETDIIAVDAYDRIDSSRRAYDYSDNLKFNNITVPALTETLFSRSGDELSTAYNLSLFTTTATTPMTFANNTTTFHVGSGRVFTGDISLTHNNSTLSLSQVRITGGVIATTINNPLVHTSEPSDRDTALAYGGPVEGATTINVPSGQTHYHYVGDITSNGYTITKTGAGTLIVGGREPGDLEGAPNNGGVVLVGTGVSFEAAPITDTIVNITIPASTAYRIEYADQADAAQVLQGVTTTSALTVELNSAAGSTNRFNGGDAVVSTTQYNTLYARQVISPIDSQTINVNATIGSTIPGLPRVTTLAADTVVVSNALVNSNSDVAVTVQNSDRGSRLNLSSIITAHCNARVTTNYLTAISALITADSTFAALSVQDVILPSAIGIDYVGAHVELRRASAENMTQVIVDGRTVDLGGASILNSSGDADEEAGETAPSRLDASGNAEVVFARRRDAPTAETVAAAAREVISPDTAAIVNGATGANVDTSGNNSGATILPILFTKN